MAMPFLWTLQRYIFREMGKTFLLTALALTAVLGLGGGVLQMIKLGEVTPGQLGRLLLFMLPISAALTLPIAALFSAAATYGRLSADNEFVACRSSGINMHVLFLPAIALSLFSAGVTYTFSNFVVPGMVQNLETFIYSDFGTLIRQRLNRPRGLSLGGRFRISADANAVDVANPDRIEIDGIRFIEVDHGEWVRYGTARKAVIEFDRKHDTPRVRGVMYDISMYDRNPPRFQSADMLRIPANEIPNPLSRKLKFLRLGELLHYWREPGEWDRVRGEMDRLRLAVGRHELFAGLWKEWLGAKRIVLSDASYRVTLDSETGFPQPGGTGIELQNVTIEEVGPDRTRTATAARATIEVERGDSLEDSRLVVEGFDARIRDGQEWVAKTKAKFGPVKIGAEFTAAIEAISDEALLRADTSEEADPRLEARRKQAIESRSETLRRIVSTINERTAFSISVVVLVVLGAVLGIVFRGSHVMVAFGISFVPSLLVLVTILMGKQMSYNAPTYAWGLAVMWGGIALVCGLDFWTLTRVLRR